MAINIKLKKTLIHEINSNLDMTGKIVLYIILIGYRNYS